MESKKSNRNGKETLNKQESENILWLNIEKYISFISLKTDRDLSKLVIFAKSCRDDINPIIIVQNQLRYYCCGNKNRYLLPI